MLVLSSDLRHVVAVAPRADLRLDGKLLRGGIAPWPLDATLRIDRKRCKERFVPAGQF